MCDICLFLIQTQIVFLKDSDDFHFLHHKPRLLFPMSTKCYFHSFCKLVLIWRQRYLWVKCISMTGTKAEFFFPLLLISVEVHRFFLQVCKTTIFMYQGYQLFVMLLQFFCSQFVFCNPLCLENNFYGCKCHFFLNDFYSCNYYSPIF